MTQLDLEPVANQMQKRELTPLALMMAGLESGKLTTADLQVLQEMHFRQQAKDAEIEFNLAMNAVQAEITRVHPDAYNSQTKSKWATYAALDKMLRPLYTKNGFSLSFDSGDCSVPEHVVAYCYVSHAAGHTRKYQSPPMPKPILGPQGKPVMTDTHGTGSAMSYAKRYLLAYIFNIPVGDEDTDGNAPMSGAEADKLQEWIDSIEASASFEELQARFTEAYRAHENQTARDAIIAAKDRQKKKLLAQSKAGAR